MTGVTAADSVPVATKETPMVLLTPSQRDERQFAMKAWSHFWGQTRTLALASDRDIKKQFNFKNEEFPLITVSPPISTGSFLVGFPETIKVKFNF